MESTTPPLNIRPPDRLWDEEEDLVNFHRLWLCRRNYLLLVLTRHALTLDSRLELSRVMLNQWAEQDGAMRRYRVLMESPRPLTREQFVEIERCRQIWFEHAPGLDETLLRMQPTLMVHSQAEEPNRRFI